MKVFIIINSLIIFLGYTECYSQNNFEELYNIIRKRPETRISILDNKIQVINIYKQQVLSVYKSRNKGEEERILQYINDVYNPSEEYWNNFFDKTGFEKWLRKNWAKLNDINTPGYLLPFKINFDSLFTVTVDKVNQLTSREPTGKWYLVYGNKSSNMGGFYSGDMFVDFFGIGKKDTGHIVFNLPHEINHQIYTKTNPDDHTLLYTIIDEGFACYVNYKYWEGEFSPAKNINFTEEEWQWCKENESKIFAYTKTYMDSTEEEIKNKFQRGNNYIFEGAPDRIAYFIGFRICETYEEEKGKDSWKEIYNLMPQEVLKESKYQIIIEK